MIETYNENADNMLKYIRKKQPAAEIVLHSTWAYEVGSTHPSFGNYNKDQTTMHNAIKEAVTAYCEYAATLTTDDGAPISLNGKPLGYIPTGDAFYNARQSKMFDTTYIYKDSTLHVDSNPKVDTTQVCTLHRDSYHASYHYGRYLAALTWYACLTGNSVAENKYINAKYPIPEEARPIINAAAQKAVNDCGLWNQ